MGKGILQGEDNAETPADAGKEIRPTEGSSLRLQRGGVWAIGHSSSDGVHGPGWANISRKPVGGVVAQEGGRRVRPR